jgi:hypothetical protein
MAARLLRALAALAAALVLAGCENQTASYRIDGNDHYLTLARKKPYMWSTEYQLELVVARLPECQRRHRLQPAPLAQARVDLFRSLEGGFILRQGDNYYVAETGQCRLQQFPAPPREPGEPLGVFDVREGRLRFIAAGR